MGWEWVLVLSGWAWSKSALLTGRNKGAPRRALLEELCRKNRVREGYLASIDNPALVVY